MEDVWPFIVQYFSLQSYTALSLVCKSWRLYISKSSLYIKLPYIIKEKEGQYFSLCVFSHLQSLKVSTDWSINCEYLSQCHNLKHLTLYGDRENVPTLTNLVSLKIHSKIFTNTQLSKMTNLQSLSLLYTDIFTDDSLFSLVKLTSLNAGNNQFTSKSISRLHKLKELKLHGNSSISNNDLKGLIQLKTLHLIHDYKNIADDGIRQLTNLTELDLSFNDTITNKGICHLTHLKKLSLRRTAHVNDKGIAKLTNLTHLDLRGNQRITVDVLKYLTKLKHLDVRENKTMSVNFKEYLKINPKCKVHYRAIFGCDFYYNPNDVLYCNGS